MELTTIRLEKSDRIATITLNRPDNMNAFNIVMLRELIAAFEAVALDDEIRVVILTGQGRAFCAGADVNQCPPELPKIAETVEKLLL